MDFEEIGLRIKNCRIQKGLTQEKLAELMDVSAHYIYEIERGSKTMSLYTLHALSKCLGISTDYLLYGNNTSRSKALPEDALSSITKDLSQKQRNRLAAFLRAAMPYLSLDEGDKNKAYK